MRQLTVGELEAGLEEIRGAPADGGRVEMIVRRPEVDAREVLVEGRLDLAEGLVGDGWRDRPSPMTSDRSPHPEMQVKVTSARVVALLAGSVERWPLAGDQLYVDLDLSQANLPPGSRLAVGSAVIEISQLPHKGCAKFANRYGLDALRFVSTPEGRALRLRGLNAWVVVPGAVRVGDAVRKLAAQPDRCHGR